MPAGRIADLPDPTPQSPIQQWAWALAVGGLVLLAAIVRLPDLMTRATWDADEGREMFVLMGLVRDGTLPLLGPITSFGMFHHGALWYYVLAPAAWLGNGDPTAVVVEIALLASVAVGLIASLVKSVAGPVAGLVAGLLMALSASAISESTFFWNPNIVAFFVALAVWAAWRAWSTESARWWLLAAFGQAASMQCHVLGAIFLVPFVAWFIADLRRRSGGDRRRIARVGLGAILVVVLTYLPFIASELQTGFGEVRSVIDFVSQGHATTDPGQGLAFRLIFIPLRTLSWPLTGLITDALLPGFLAATAVIALLAWLWRTTGGPRWQFVGWLAATVIWSCLALAFAVPSLEFVTPLPVDHYHAFLDPLVFVVVGIGLGTLWQRGTTSITRTAPGPAPVSGFGGSGGRIAVRSIVAGLVAVLVGWNMTHWPPRVTPDGGYPAAEAAAERIEASIGDRVTLVVSLPDFKSAEAYTYPLSRIGAPAYGVLADPRGLDSMVVLCDSLFVADCGGPAEDPRAAPMTDARLVDRFIAAPGRMISVYLGRPGG